MNPGLEPARQQVAEAGRRLVADGLVIGTAGNVSVRFGDLVAISPSGIPYHRVNADDVCIVDLSGAPLPGLDTPPPSSETPMHLAIYAHTGAGSVVHHHGLASATVSAVVDELPPLHYYALQLGGPTRVAEYATFGTEELANSVNAALEDRTAALMQNHGAVAYGDTLDSAYHRAQLLEWLASLHIQAHSLGKPRVLTPVELEDVTRRKNERAPR
ncbi:class II aldolase/adducin family protein [Amycolatopsis benzoatilytica]|uniref:class II aldolase/adducin family protein n=1 Tax=Amycolatopsis benzoatilytica TaxID=346045 RepID=UPI0003745C5C|nr:class II aldolase/adducin family protein [Amycolatopsis benzoatilytica]